MSLFSFSHIFVTYIIFYSAIPCFLCSSAFQKKKKKRISKDNLHFLLYESLPLMWQSPVSDGQQGGSLGFLSAGVDTDADADPTNRLTLTLTLTFTLPLHSILVLVSAQDRLHFQAKVQIDPMYCPVLYHVSKVSCVS